VQLWGCVALGQPQGLPVRAKAGRDLRRKSVQGLISVDVMLIWVDMKTVSGSVFGSRRLPTPNPSEGGELIGVNGSGEEYGGIQKSVSGGIRR
jgi:hypothetical protein